MPSSTDSQLLKWTAPECPFPVEYVPRVLDDIRLAVVDAFFSLPRGGAEVGGILLGRWEKGRVGITGSLPLDCEHAFGPSFTLSETDRTRLAEMITAAQKNPKARPVGWYHSHTRSEIFLSDADQEIQKTFFPEPWQVALVLRPHTFHPTRAGFFFRGKDGAIRGDASSREFVLEPLPLQPLPSLNPGAARPPAAPEPAGRVINISQAIEQRPSREPAAEEPEAAPAAPAAAVPPPAFLAMEPPRSRRWLGMVAVLLGLAAGAAGYQTRQKWIPVVAGWFRPTAPLAPAAAGLTAVEHDGQLLIRWDGNSPDVRRSTGGVLLIADGPEPRSMPLDAVHLRAGSFTYARQSERVDVTLSLVQPNGQRRLQATTFAGKLTAPASAPAPAAAEAELRQERDDLAKENARLKQALARQTERAQRLEKLLDEQRKERQAEQQRKRLGNQVPDRGK